MQLDDVVRSLVLEETAPLKRELEALRSQLRELQREKRLLTVEEFCEQHPEWTLGAVRWRVFNRKQLGLERAILQPTGKGGRVKIDPEEFLRWAARKKGRRR
jgi:hypothetical protein